jgi:class 3 adenylate cyclase/predicted ATPase
MHPIAHWLNALGLGQYAQRFADNDIDASILRDLTDQDLEKIGVSLGHRKKILRAIAELNEVGITPESPGWDEAERRLLTVMFADLVGSTALSTRLDPEDMRKIIGAYQRRCAEVIAKSGGFVARYMGDGILAYFGYPQAHEEDAERAVHAGLELIEAVGKLDDGAGSVLHMRVAVATGLVVVGDLRSEGVAQEHEVVGETPNLAARLQTLAEPDTVVISGSTRRLLGELFETRALGTVSVKGFSAPVPVWQVTGASAVDSRFEALRRGSIETPLVGREEEIELLLRRWQQAKRGDGCVVLISGEAGIGKSRIAQTVLARLSGEPHIRLRYFCSPHHTDSAFYPIIRQLERAAGFEQEDTPETKLNKVTSLLDPSSGQENGAQLLSELLSIATGNDYSALNWSPQRKKEKTFDLLLRQLQTLSRQRPAFVVYEDVHWIDPSSRELLDVTVERVAGLPVLLIVTFRPEFQPPWTGEAHVSTLTLGRLGRREGAELVELVAGNNLLSKGVRAEIVERADGIPLFVEELTKAVLDEAVTGADSTAPRQAPVVPATLHASLMARLDRLGTAARETAQVGAAIGREFTYEMIAAVADRSDDVLRAGLDQLVDAGLVFRRGSLPGATFLFKHALVQDVAYGSLLKSRRQHLHGRIAQMLEERMSDQASIRPEFVASHYAQAGVADRAIEYWDKAGRLAVERSAMAEAVAHFGKAIHLLASRPEGEQRRAIELALQLALAGALMAVKGWGSSEAGDAYARARELCREAPKGSQLAMALGGEWTFLHNRGEIRVAHQLADELIALADHRKDRETKLMANRCLGTSELFCAEFTRALHHLRQALTFYDWTEHRPPTLTPYDIRVACESFVAWTLLILGYADQALAQSRHALACARELLQPHTLAYGLHLSCIFHQLRGDGPELQERSQELVALATEQGYPHFVGTGTCFRGWATVALGGPIVEAINELHRGLAAKRATGADIKIPYYFGLLAEAHRRIGRTSEGLTLLNQALEVIERTGESWFEAELYRLIGETLLTNVDLYHAELWFSRALTKARTQKAKLWELRASCSLARLLGDEGKRSEARELLAPVYGWFSEGFNTTDLKEAKAILEELE